MGKVLAVCTSEKKGTQKEDVGTIEVIEDYGVKGDAHAGKWHRQVSLLSYEKIEEFRNRGAQVEFGAFGENFVVEGYDFKTLQIGKECHQGCAIYQTMGDCIMPREGVFCKVLHGGTVKNGDEFTLIEEA